MVAAVLREKRGLTLLNGGVKTPRKKQRHPQDRSVVRLFHPETNQVVFITAILPYDDGGAVS